MNKLNNFLVLQKSIKIFIGLLIFGSFSQIKAQDRLPFDQGNTYILAKVDIVGKISFNANTVTTFAGLEKGQEITVPGEQITNAIKKLGKLGLFDEISFYINRIEKDSIYLDLHVEELPKLNEVKFVGVSKSKIEGLIKDNGLTKEKVVNENLITTTKYYIENKYKKDGFYNTKVIINTVIDTSLVNHVNMVVKIDKGSKVKINDIVFEGNKEIKSETLRAAMKDTKRKKLLTLKASKFIKAKYDEDLNKLIEAYKERGYRDARIISDSVAYNADLKALMLKIKVEEGNKYRFGNIKFLGNTVYSDEGLLGMIGIKKGDTYNGVLLEKRIADKSKPDGDDITNLYQNNGYLFSNINAVETKTANDSIDFEIRITEGPIAYFNKITVTGNDKTNDHVVYRELRTKPGEKYNKDLLIRTIREIGQLGFFDPETIEPKFKNVDAAAGTVDIDYPLTEKGASQIELQGGYGGGGFIGTLGLSFNNFSARNLFNKEAYKPLPMGDGQKVALRLQASSFFRTYSLSFSEPWFGQRKPVQLNTSFSYTTQYNNNFQTQQVDRSKSFNIMTISAGIYKRLSVPDDYFGLSQTISYQHYDLRNYNTGLFTFGNGASRNLAYTIGLSRSNKGINPIFPIYGAEFSVTGKFTLPYSLFNGVDYATLGDQKEYKLKYDGTQVLSSSTNPDGQIISNGNYLKETTPGSRTYYPVGDDYTLASADDAIVDQKRYNWLEYYKLKFKGDWYTKVAGTNKSPLVLRSLIEFGFLGAYNQERGMIPFERFFLGGDGMQNFAMDGREVIALRGYPNGSLTPVTENGQSNGANIYNKFSLELRYPITLKASASIYALTFLEAGSSFDTFKNYNPFALNRSAGAGLRIFMPAFGLLGIDFGYGFDGLPQANGSVGPKANGWETHFIIGQQF